MMKRLAAALAVSILAAPATAVMLMVNTNSYPDVYDGSLSLEEFKAHRPPHGPGGPGGPGGGRPGKPGGPGGDRPAPAK